MSLVTSQSLARRTVLRGLGATLALPLLDAMIPAFAPRAATRPAHRFLTFYVPNGMAMEFWTPKGDGADFQLSPVLEPLSPSLTSRTTFSSSACASSCFDKDALPRPPDTRSVASAKP